MTHEKATEQDMGVSDTDAIALDLTKRIEREFYYDHPGGSVQVRAKVQSIIADFIRTAKPAPEWQGMVAVGEFVASSPHGVGVRWGDLGPLKSGDKLYAALQTPHEANPK